jgi:hypothetical protein
MPLRRRAGAGPWREQAAHPRAPLGREQLRLRLRPAAARRRARAFGGGWDPLRGEAEVQLPVGMQRVGGLVARLLCSLPRERQHVRAAGAVPAGAGARTSLSEGRAGIAGRRGLAGDPEPGSGAGTRCSRAHLWPCLAAVCLPVSVGGSVARPAAIPTTGGDSCAAPPASRSATPCCAAKPGSAHCPGRVSRSPGRQ